eukprot:scaffold12206_cov100-Isochrysis_galbana.AAC.3
MSESALSGGRSPVWPRTGACRLASCVPGASCSRAWVWSIGGSVMIALHAFVVVCAPTVGECLNRGKPQLGRWAFYWEVRL